MKNTNISLILDRVPGFTRLKAEIADLHSGHSYFVSGGAIRNISLDKKVADVDVFLPAALLSVIIDKKMFPDHELDIGPLGSPRWYFSSQSYFDLVPIETVRHGFLAADNIDGVLSRADFTGNAMAFDPVTGALINPYNGWRDMRDGVLRAVRFDVSEERVSPESKLTWRHLLWFRLNFYHRKLRLRYDRATYEWMIQNRALSSLKSSYQEFRREPAKCRGFDNIIRSRLQRRLRALT